MQIQEALDNILDIFQRKDFPAAMAITTIKRVKGSVVYPSDKYSLINRLILRLNGIDIAMGYKAWNSYNRYVVKGAKAVKIFAPITKTIKAEDSDDGKEKILIVGFKTTNVFGLESTDGEPLPDMPDYTPDPDNIPKYLNVASALGIKVVWAAANSNAYGWYNSNSKTLTLCSKDPIVSYHELGHSLYDHINKMNLHDYAYNEIVAELYGAVMCELSNIRGYHEQTYDYIREYCKDKSDKAVMTAITNVLNDVEELVVLTLKTAENIR